MAKTKNKITKITLAGHDIYSVKDLENAPKKGNYLVLAADGWFEIVHTPIGSLSRKITGIITKSKDYDMGESFAPTFPKIPMKLYKTVINMFDLVYKEHYSEAAVILFLNQKTKEWKFYVPKQEVSSTSVDYSLEQDIEEDEELKDLIKNGFDAIGTIHSHGNMNASHSSTDDKDEEHFDGLHITIGNFASGKTLSNPTHSFSFVWRGTRFKLTGNDVIKHWLGYDIDIKKEWLDKITKKPYNNTSGYNKNSHYPVAGYGHHSAVNKKKVTTGTTTTNNQKKGKQCGISSATTSKNETKDSLNNRLCFYKAGDLKCDIPIIGEGWRCVFHRHGGSGIVKDILALMDPSDEANLVECECGELYFLEDRKCCKKPRCVGKIVYSKQYYKPLFTLLEAAELDLGSLLGLPRDIALELLQDLELISLNEIESKAKISNANYLLKKILEKVKLPL